MNWLGATVYVTVVIVLGALIWQEKPTLLEINIAIAVIALAMKEFD